MIAQAGEVEEGAGGAVGGGGVDVFDLDFERVERIGEEGAEAIGVISEDGFSRALQRGAEGGVVVLPAVEGFTVDAQLGDDDAVGLAGEE
jgi:hypothetical protein